MATFYRGAGIGTYWHRNNAQVDGFLAHRPAERPSAYLLMRHIQNGPNVGPYISLTRSYEVAEAYAIMGHKLPIAAEPAYVYEIVCDANDRDSRAVELIDPILELAKNWPDPFAEQFYHHDGGQDFLHGVISPKDFSGVLNRNYRQAPPGGGTPRPPNLRQELEVLVRALRDSEVLAIRAIPAYCVKNRFPIFFRQRR